MYVAELDRPWEDTNFLFQGFLIEHESQIKELYRQCSYVLVTQARSDPTLFVKDAEPNPASCPSLIPAKKVDTPVHARVALQHESAGIFSGLKTILREAMSVRRDKNTHRRNEVPQRPNNKGNSQPVVTQDETARDTENLKKLRQSFSATGTDDVVVIQYENTTLLDEELHTSKQVHNEFCSLASDLLEQLSVEDLSERIDYAGELITSVVDSMVRNVDAMDLLSRLKRVDEYSYSHAINVSVRLISFGRQLGFPREHLLQLGLGGLLLDIGRTKLPESLASVAGKYTHEEFEQEKRHVAEGIELLSMTNNVSIEVMQMVKHHHERFDGSGYPGGIQGEKIGLLGCMAGIVDTYCAMIVRRPYSSTITSANALGALLELGNKSFHSGLVDQFVQAIGIYPVGCLVELTSSEIGVVVQQNRARRLRPVVLVILDRNREAYSSPTTVDLMHMLVSANGESLSIRQELQSGAYGIDPAEYFL